MKKSGPNAHWNKLTPEQRDSLDEWLFDQRLSYPQALAKAQTEFGFEGSESSLKRYYTRRRQERVIENLPETRKYAAAINQEATNPNEVRAASMKLLEAYLLQAVTEAPEAVKTWAPVAKVILHHERNELLRELKGEENQLRRAAVEFAREKYEYDMTEKALTALPALNELADARKDPHLKRYEANARRNRLRRMMFGPGINVEPENEQEAAEMLAAKHEREARKQRQLQPPSAGDSLKGPPVPSSQYYEGYMAAKKAEEKHQGPKMENIEQPTSHAQHPRAEDNFK